MPSSTQPGSQKYFLPSSLFPSAAIILILCGLRGPIVVVIGGISGGNDQNGASGSRGSPLVDLASLIWKRCGGSCAGFGLRRRLRWRGGAASCLLGAASPVPAGRGDS